MKSLSKYMKSIFEAKENHLEDFKKELESIVECMSNNIDIYEKGRMISIVEKEGFKKNIDSSIKVLCEKYGVFIANIDEDDAPPKYIRVMFESIYGEKVEVKDDICFHLTDEIDGDDKVKSIMKDGLIPMKAFRKFKMKNYHPERIYLLTKEVSQSLLKKYASQLSAGGIIIIDLKKLKEDYSQSLDFFKDPQSRERISVYTDEKIRKEVLTYMKLNDFYKSDIFNELGK